MTMVMGVKRSRIQASFLSIEYRRRNAPASWNTVISISGTEEVVVLLMTSISLAMRDVISPECKTVLLYSCLENNMLKRRRRIVLDCLMVAAVVI